MMNAEAIRDKVSVTGVGCCKFGENWDQSREDMMVDAVYEAYADAGIEDPDKQIDAIFAGAVYPREGSGEVAEALHISTPSRCERAAGGAKGMACTHTGQTTA